MKVQQFFSAHPVEEPKPTPRVELPISDLFDPKTVATVDQLEMVAARVVEGYVTGKHRSPFKGGCVEFAEHRSYTPGDEIRLLDWRAIAKSDRYYIKQFEEETNLQCTLVLDASGSMAFGHSTVPKLRYAQMAAACLARLMLSQRDAVGLSIIDTKIRSHIPPRSRPAHLRSLVEALAATQPGGETSLAGILHELAEKFRRRGLTIIFSDCFDDVEALLNALHHLRSRGHDPLMFHVMAPEELSFSFNKWSRFECLEVNGRRLELDPVSVREEYLKRVKVFLERLRQGCGEVGCDYCPIATNEDLGTAIGYYLHRRVARMK